jgi:hypothetical protein
MAGSSLRLIVMVRLLLLQSNQRFSKAGTGTSRLSYVVAALAGLMGESTEKGFVLNEPNIQVFEKKPKEPKEAATPVASAAG